MLPKGLCVQISRCIVAIGERSAIRSAAADRAQLLRSEGRRRGNIPAAPEFRRGQRRTGRGVRDPDRRRHRDRRGCCVHCRGTRARNPRTVDAGARIAARPARSVRRTTRAIVVEPAGDARPDRLDHELDVAARPLLPLTVDRLVAVLDEFRPRLMLCKHSLDGIDESVMEACRGARRRDLRAGASGVRGVPDGPVAPLPVDCHGCGCADGPVGRPTSRSSGRWIWPWRW